MWGDPGVRKFGGPFKKLSDNIMESVYAITYNFKSLLGHYIKIDDAFGGEDDRNQKIDSVKKVKQVDEGISRDTTTYNFDAKKIDRSSDRHLSGFNKDVVGYKQAQKDSAYHVNRSNTSVKIEVKLTKKYH